MKRLFFLLLFLFSTISWVSAMDPDSQEEALEAHRIALIRDLESDPNIRQLKPAEREVHYHCVRSFARLGLGPDFYRAMLSSLKYLPKPDPRKPADVEESFEGAHESITMAANASRFFSLCPDPYERTWRQFEFHSHSPQMLRHFFPFMEEFFGFEGAQQYLSTKKGLERQWCADLIDDFQRFHKSHYENLEQRRIPFRENRDALVRGLRGRTRTDREAFRFGAAVLWLEPSCIQALAKHAEAFFYNYKLPPEGGRTRVVYTLSRSSLTADEMDSLGEIMKVVGEDVQGEGTDFRRRLQDILEVVFNKRRINNLDD